MKPWRPGRMSSTSAAGQLVPSGIAEPELAAAVRACASAGVLIVAAVGNDGCDCLHVPAALPCVLAVGTVLGRQPTARQQLGIHLPDAGNFGPR